MLPIERAKLKIKGEVYTPAMMSQSLLPKTKNVIKNESVWLEKFRYIGDLLDYLSRFNDYSGSAIYQDLKDNNFKTYEELYPELSQEFELWKDERARLNDFVIGQSYGTHDILIPAKIYDTRVGGILPIGEDPNFEAIVIKVTLNGGKYQNEWLENKVKLKYYFKSISNNFKDSFKENRAILENHLIPIYAFVREDKEHPFIFEGIFQYESHHNNLADGTKWFVLNNRASESLIRSEYIQEQLINDIESSIASTSHQRRARLSAANKKPKKIYTLTTSYQRNSDVIAEVLTRARGICEKCLNPAPFLKKSNNRPYLEVHHKIRLADGGDDTVENALALCPNCHRESHFGSNT